MSTVKQRVQEIIEQLPDDCTLDDIQYQLYVLEEIEAGERSAETGPTFTHEEAGARLSKWLTRSSGQTSR